MPPLATSTSAQRRSASKYVWLKRLTQAAAAVFVAWTVWLIAQRWSGLPQNLSTLPVVLAGLCLLLSNLVAAQAWRLLLQGLSGRIFPNAWLLHVFLSSQLARYTPGKLGLPALRVASLGPRGVKAPTVISSTLLEVGSWAMTSAAVACLVLGFFRPAWLSQWLLESAQLDPAVVSVGLAVLGIAVLLVSRWRLDKLPASWRQKLHLYGDGPLIPPAAVMLHCVYWGCWLLHGWLLLGALGTNDWGAAAGFVLAPVAGFVALLAPAGAGVREAVLSAALAPSIGWSNAAAVSLLSRALSLGADMGAWAAVAAWLRVRRAA